MYLRLATFSQLSYWTCDRFPSSSRHQWWFEVRPARLQIIFNALAPIRVKGKAGSRGSRWTGEDPVALDEKRFWDLGITVVVHLGDVLVPLVAIMKKRVELRTPKIIVVDFLEPQARSASSWFDGFPEAVPLECRVTKIHVKHPKQ